MILLWVLLLCACTDQTSQSAWRGTVDTLASGTIIVKNPDSPLWDSTSAWRFEEDLRIGDAEGSGPAIFGGVAALAQDSTGRLFVLDDRAQQVRVFSPTGEFERSIGRPGSGPGELRLASGLVIDTSGVLWIVDSGNARYQAFDGTGKYLRMQQRRVVGTLYPFLGGLTRQRFLDLSLAMQQPGLIEYTFVAPDLATGRIDSFPPLLFQRGSDPPRTIALFRVLARLVFRLDSRGHIWFGRNDEYRIYQRTLAGDTVRVIEKVARARDVTVDEKHAIVEEIRNSDEPGQVTLVPDRRPLYERFLVDSAGYLFVMMAAAPGESHTRFDVFDPLGRYLGQMELPHAFAETPAAPPFINADCLVGPTVDAEGVVYVSRFRIIRSRVRS